ncbi:MAG: selenocysteine-specific translation elongation factor [Vicinamibacterales bacterium]
MRTVVVGTAGHIDHGKSALVKALTGTDPDRLKEEKARGITIALGFAHAPVSADVLASFVDVPGHERFVRAMLAGVGGIDIVLLVVAADESVMPQTREHFDICRLLGIAHGLVVVTKADLVDDEMLALVADDVGQLVAGSFLEGAPIVPVSALSGAGLDRLTQTIADIAGRVPVRDAGGAVRLPIDRAFTLKGFGTVVTGTLASGAVRADDDLDLLPSGRRVKVRGLHVHGGRRDRVTAGERVAANLAAIDVADVARGEALVTPGAFAVTRWADARLSLLPGVTLKHGARVRVHHGTADWLARVAVTGEAGSIPPGGSADVRVRFEAPAVLARGDRIIVRSYSPLVTIGGGVVLDPLPPRPGVRTARGVARLAALAPRPDPLDDRRHALGVMIDAAGARGVRLGELGQRVGAPVAVVSEDVEAAAKAGRVVRGGEWAVAAAIVERRSAALLAGLAAHHASEPLAAGVGLEDARARWFRGLPGAVVDAALAALVARGQLVATDVVALPGHRVSLSPEEAALDAWIDARFLDAGLAPPDVAALAGESGRPGAMVDRVLQLMVKGKRLVRVDTLVFHREVLERLKDEIRGLKAGAPAGRATVDVKAFKDTYNVTRKYAIPLLEYLDRERVTRRAGDARIVL